MCGVRLAEQQRKWNKKKSTVGNGDDQLSPRPQDTTAFHKKMVHINKVFKNKSGYDAIHRSSLSRKSLFGITDNAVKPPATCRFNRGFDAIKPARAMTVSLQDLDQFTRATADIQHIQRAWSQQPPDMPYSATRGLFFGQESSRHIRIILPKPFKVGTLIRMHAVLDVTPDALIGQS